MNYRHEYHAGSLSDVFKHTLLVGLIKALLFKETPLCYMETHAGAGLYDISKGLAQKTGESKEGIHKLIEQPLKSLPPLLAHYVDCVQQAGYPGAYPGSPAIAQSLLRATDRLVLCERHPPVYRLLKRHLRDTRTQIHAEDGFVGLKAFLPPFEKRGLVFMDPPFEKKEDWARLIEGLAQSLKKFRQGVYAIWFPIKDLKLVQLWIHRMQVLGLQNAWVFEWMFNHPKHIYWGLPGCGMLIVNMPFNLHHPLAESLSYLSKHLGRVDSAYRFYRLDNGSGT
jgi:23S rRNA (adenine2030-N6)-methyltransferase